MRSFTDSEANLWDVAIERESYGAYRLIFARRAGPGLRHLLLAASTFDEAQQELAGMSEGELRGWLAQAEPWPG